MSEHSTKPYNLGMTRTTVVTSELKPLCVSTTNSSGISQHHRQQHQQQPSPGDDPDATRHPEVKALKGLDVRLPPSIAALEEERIVDGISLDARSRPALRGMTSPSLPPSTTSPISEPSPPIIQQQQYQLQRQQQQQHQQYQQHFQHLRRQRENHPQPSGGDATSGSVRTVAHGQLEWTHGLSVDAGHQQHHRLVQYHPSSRPQFVEAMEVNGEDGEAYYLMETDEKEPQEVYYVVSDVAQFL